MLIVPVQEILCVRARSQGIQPRADECSALASDKLFFLIFQSAPDLILRWLQNLPADAGYSAFKVNDRPIQEICAMGGITVEDFTKSRAYQEIFGE